MDEKTKEKLDELVLDWQKQLVEAADSSRGGEDPEYYRGMTGTYYSVIEAINDKFGTNYLSFYVQHIEDLKVNGTLVGSTIIGWEKELREHIKTPTKPLCKEVKEK